MGITYFVPSDESTPQFQTEKNPKPKGENREFSKTNFSSSNVI